MVPDGPPAVQGSAPCVCPRDGRPRGLRVLGYVSGGRVDGVDCAQPLRVVCSDCSGQEVWPCNCHRASKCPPCAAKYRRRLTRITEAGIVKRTGGWYVGMLTLNAPGETPGHLRWVPEGLPRDLRRARFAQREVCRCEESMGESLGHWNAQASACWNRLRTALARSHPGLQFLRAAEVQDGKRRSDGRGRGAIHFHVIVASREPIDLAAVQEKALAAGFGCVLDYAPITDARRASWYVSKYVTKSVEDRGEVPWVAPVADEETGEVRPMRTLATFRSWSASRDWGLTMREVREALRDAARRRAAAIDQVPVLDPPATGSPPLAAAAAGASPPPTS